MAARIGDIFREYSVQARFKVVFPRTYMTSLPSSNWRLFLSHMVNAVSSKKHSFGFSWQCLSGGEVAFYENKVWIFALVRLCP